MEVRGRNGWFYYERRDVDCFPSSRCPDNEAWVLVYSRQLGRFAPVAFKGTLNEVLGFFEGIVEELRGYQKIAKTSRIGTGNPGK